MGRRLYQAHEGIGIVLLLLVLFPAIALYLATKLLAHSVGVHNDINVVVFVTQWGN